MGLAHQNTLTGHCTGEWLVYLCSCTKSRSHNIVSKAGQDPLPLGEAGRACPIEKWYSFNNRSCRFSGIWLDLIPEPILESQPVSTQIPRVCKQARTVYWAPLVTASGSWSFRLRLFTAATYAYSKSCHAANDQNLIHTPLLNYP